MATKQKKIKRKKNQTSYEQLMSLVSSLCILVPGSILFIMFLMRLIYQDEIHIIYPESDNNNLSDAFIIDNVEQPIVLSQKQIDTVQVISQTWYNMFRIVFPFYGFKLYKSLVDIAGQSRGVLWAQCDDGTDAVYVMHPDNMDFLDNGDFRFKRNARITVVHSVLGTDSIMLKMQMAGEICRMGKNRYSISQMNRLFVDSERKNIAKHLKKNPSKKYRKASMTEYQPCELKEIEPAPIKVINNDEIDLAEELDVLGSYEP